MTEEPGVTLFRQARRSLRLQREAMVPLLESYAKNPQPASPFREDLRSLPSRRQSAQARRWILTEACRQASRIFGNVSDHLAGLEKCLTGDPEPLFCPMTLTRAALEGAVRVCYLLDCSHGLDTRLLRGAAMLLDSALAEVTAVGEIPADRTLAGAQEIVSRMRDNVQGWIGAAGICVRIDRRDRPCGMAWDQVGKNIPLKINLSNESARYFPDVPAAYRFGSGVAHSSPWMLHDPDDRPGTVYMAGAAVITCLLSLSKLAETFGRYYGHDPARRITSCLHHRRALDLTLTSLALSGFTSAGRYVGEPRLQKPPKPRRR